MILYQNFKKILWAIETISKTTRIVCETIDTTKEVYHEITTSQEKQ